MNSLIRIRIKVKWDPNQNDQWDPNQNVSNPTHCVLYDLETFEQF